MSELKVIKGIDAMKRDFCKRKGIYPNTLFVPFGARYEFLSELQPIDLNFKAYRSVPRDQFMGMDVVFTVNAADIGVGYCEFLTE